MFRIYDANDPVDTLATSHAWQVDAQGRDVELSLRFVLNQLRSTDGKGSVMGALAQLAHLLEHLQVSGRNVSKRKGVPEEERSKPVFDARFGKLR